MTAPDGLAVQVRLGPSDWANWEECGILGGRRARFGEHVGTLPPPRNANTNFGRLWLSTPGPMQRLGWVSGEAKECARFWSWTRGDAPRARGRREDAMEAILRWIIGKYRPTVVLPLEFWDASQRLTAGRTIWADEQGPQAAAGGLMLMGVDGFIFDTHHTRKKWLSDPKRPEPHSPEGVRVELLLRNEISACSMFLTQDVWGYVIEEAASLDDVVRGVWREVDHRGNLPSGPTAKAYALDHLAHIHMTNQAGPRERTP